MWYVKLYLGIGFMIGIGALFTIQVSIKNYEKYIQRREISSIKEFLCMIAEEWRDDIDEDTYLTRGIIVFLSTFFCYPSFLIFSLWI
ncbi:MAG: hypothetical protein G01um101433_731 [Parcubacteria group bacterium Gr01-1014_33]|nr:MAG: hypothetical protein G01um101433_731 [Parcubacteria group bacterium Gr01-1014_33]